MNRHSGRGSVSESHAKGSGSGFDHQHYIFDGEGDQLGARPGRKERSRGTRLFFLLWAEASMSVPSDMAKVGPGAQAFQSAEVVS